MSYADAVRRPPKLYADLGYKTNSGGKKQQVWSMEFKSCESEYSWLIGSFTGTLKYLQSWRKIKPRRNQWLLNLTYMGESGPVNCYWKGEHGINGGEEQGEICKMVYSV
ncbi:hypothetical protein Ancab_008160, partial [Ancistrocladus abbreviatus]